MKTKSIIHMLYVQDMDRAVKFYKNVFGFNLVSKSDFWSNLSCGNGMIALTSHGKKEEQRTTNLIIEVDDHVQAASSIESNGGVVLKIHDPYPGAAVYNVECIDPENNHIIVSCKAKEKTD